MSSFVDMEETGERGYYREVKRNKLRVTETNIYSVYLIYLFRVPDHTCNMFSVVSERMTNVEAMDDIEYQWIALKDMCKTFLQVVLSEQSCTPNL